MQTQALIPFADLCQSYQLGHLYSANEINGGRIHRVWKLHTDQGYFALKLLNPSTINGAQDIVQREAREAAARWFAQAQIPAVSALLHQDAAIQCINQQYLSIFPWIEGQHILGEAIKVEQAYRMGTLVAKMHRVSFPEYLEIPTQRLTGMVHSIDLWWSAFHEIHALAERDASLSHFISQLHELIVLWQSKHECYYQVIHKKWPRITVCHGDMDPWNILWHGDKPHIIDWELTSQMAPEVNLMSTALYWSCRADGTISFEHFQAVEQAYQDAGGQYLANKQDAFKTVMIIWLDWLYYNLQRILGRQVLRKEEQVIAQREAEKDVVQMGYILRNESSWLKYQRGAINLF